MSIEERNKLSDRKRIKQYLEKTMREAVDVLTDSKVSQEITLELFSAVMEMIKNCSIIYKNMGFDKGDMQFELPTMEEKI